MQPKSEFTCNEQRIFILDDLLAILNSLLPYSFKLHLFLLEKYGCSANVFALGESFIDQHGRVTRWYVDQFGSRVRLRPNSELRATGMPLQPNLLMFHGVNIKGTAECPRFIARFESPFDAMWRNIPRGIEREIDKSDFRSIEPEVLN
jgi:hypothetical protein